VRLVLIPRCLERWAEFMSGAAGWNEVRYCRIGDRCQSRRDSELCADCSAACIPSRAIDTGAARRKAPSARCRDGKWRAVRPGSFPLVDGAPSRVGRLRAYGNAIVEPQQRAFIEAFLESEAVGHVPDRGLSRLTFDVEDLIG
jgi:hypothetical protein